MIDGRQMQFYRGLSPAEINTRFYYPGCMQCSLTLAIGFP